MTQLTRILSGIGVASLALSIGCGLQPSGVDAEESAATLAGPPHVSPLPPQPGPGPIHINPCWLGHCPVVTYPDYGIDPDEWGCVPCTVHLPPAIDFENWDGHDLWGTHTGSIQPYFTFNTADRTPGDYNFGRLELFGVDTSDNSIVWHVFAPPDKVTGGIPAALLEMTGTYDPMCQYVKFGTGGLSSGKPPKDPPQPPDGTRGGCTFWCPAMNVVRDLDARIQGCGNQGP